MNVFNSYRVIIENIVAEMTAAGDLPPDLPVDRISVEPPRDPSRGDGSVEAGGQETPGSCRDDFGQTCGR